MTTLLVAFMVVILTITIILYPLFLKKPARYFSQATSEFNESLSVLELISELEADYLQKKINKADFELASNELKRKYLHLTKGS